MNPITQFVLALNNLLNYIRVPLHAITSILMFYTAVTTAEGTLVRVMFTLGYTFFLGMLIFCFVTENPARKND